MARMYCAYIGNFKKIVNVQKKEGRMDKMSRKVIIEGESVQSTLYARKLSRDKFNQQKR